MFIEHRALKMYKDFLLHFHVRWIWVSSSPPWRFMTMFAEDRRMTVEPVWTPRRRENQYPAGNQVPILRSLAHGLGIKMIEVFRVFACKKFGINYLHLIRRYQNIFFTLLDRVWCSMYLCYFHKLCFLQKAHGHEARYWGSGWPTLVLSTSCSYIGDYVSIHYWSPFWQYLPKRNFKA